MSARNAFAPLAGPSSPPKPTSESVAGSGSQTPLQQQQKKKKKHRAGRKHRQSRRKSFAALAESEAGSARGDTPDPARSGFYMQDRNLSNTSMDSQVLLDHRSHQYGARPRRSSVLTTSLQFPSPAGDSQVWQRACSGRVNETNEELDMDEGAPLLSRSGLSERSFSRKGYGSSDGRPRFDRRGSSRSSRRPYNTLGIPTPSADRYNVNYPPSMPPSPRLGTSVINNFGDEMMREEMNQGLLSQSATMLDREDDPLQNSSPLQRRHTVALQAEDDVCYPQEGLSEIADEDMQPPQDQRSRRGGRRRRGRWPDLSILEEWSRFEKELIDRDQERRIKKVTEPQLINGRLRPVHKGWFKAEEDAPYRFTYFNEELQSTIHSQTISELVQPESSFRELFIPDPPILSDSSDESEVEDPFTYPPNGNGHAGNGIGSGPKLPARQPSLATTTRSVENDNGTLSPKHYRGGSAGTPRVQSGDGTPVGINARSPQPGELKSPSPNSQPQVRYGERPVWWLDILSPTADEMKVIQKAFGIHPLTSEDIMLQEQREKVELFRHYYFVSYRSFDQDEESETHLDPVNMYVVVFREGVLSFHFSQTPHPANVRRRVRQLKDYIMLSSDWISYAIIDDITDVFGPLVQNIQEEVDDIEDAILGMSSSVESGGKSGRQKDDEKDSITAATTTAPESDGDMLYRIGQCRKKATELLRLLGNKADVIKGFAKRCNEHYEVAPRSEIGLYLGDIQDHIITMTGNLFHADKCVPLPPS
jgi:magnesium transporter